MLQTGHDIKKNIPGTDEHAMHNPTRGTGGEGVKNAVKVSTRSLLCLIDHKDSMNTFSYSCCMVNRPVALCDRAEVRSSQHIAMLMHNGIFVPLAA